MINVEYAVRQRIDKTEHIAALVTDDDIMIIVGDVTDMIEDELDGLEGIEERIEATNYILSKFDEYLNHQEATIFAWKCVVKHCKNKVEERNSAIKG